MTFDKRATAMPNSRPRFSLTELMAVLAILGVLAAVIVPRVEQPSGHRQEVGLLRQSRRDRAASEALEAEQRHLSGRQSERHRRRHDLLSRVVCPSARSTAQPTQSIQPLDSLSATRTSDLRTAKIFRVSIRSQSLLTYVYINNCRKTDARSL